MILSFKSILKIPSDFKDNRMTATTCRSAGANITLLPWCRMVAFPAARFSCARAQSHPCTLFLFLWHTCFRFYFWYRNCYQTSELTVSSSYNSSPSCCSYSSNLETKSIFKSLSPCSQSQPSNEKETEKAQMFRLIRKECNVHL